MTLSSSSSSSSTSSAAVRVEKATSDLLIGPDWNMNIEICDSINSNHWLAKDVMKVVKKRLQHKSSTVQILTLTLLETMVKNCGDFVHFQIVDRNILQDMVKMVKKKADAKVRTKILVLLDSWQEAFGGQGGKYPQYFLTYEELRRSGVQFPRRSSDAVSNFTPLATHPPTKSTQTSSSKPNNGSRRLDEAMASEMESLSFSGLDAMGRVAELLTEMLRAVNPGDQKAVKDELIVDLVDQCRSNQKRLMQILTSTGYISNPSNSSCRSREEELLAKGLEMNDNLQSVLANHDAIASGVTLSSNNQIAETSWQSSDAVASSSQTPSKVPESESDLISIVLVGPETSSKVDELEDDDDDFALLARRHSKPQNSQTGNTENRLTTTSKTGESPENTQPCTKIADEQDMIDFLSLALTTTSDESPAHETPVSPNSFQTYPEQATSYNSYIAPWAQPQLQPQPRQFQFQSNFQQQNGVSLATEHQQSYHPAQLQHPPKAQSPMFQQPQMSSSSQYPAQYSPTYIPPPWAATPVYYSSQRPVFSNNTPHNYGTSSYGSTQPNRPQQNDQQMNSSSITNPSETGQGQKPFIPSYRLFEDLDVFKQTDGRLKDTNGSPSLI